MRQLRCRLGLTHLKFQSTHPHGVRRRKRKKRPRKRLFQSTHPHGVRPGTYENYSLCVKFQSTHPHGVRHLVLDTVKTASSFQSTHPHGVRPGHDRRRAKLDGVSIHAPSRGATSKLRRLTPQRKVSIHAPSRGATIQRSGAATEQHRFNPRTLTGCDADA